MNSYKRHKFPESALSLGKPMLSFQERIWQHCRFSKCCFQLETQSVLDHSLLRVMQGLL